VRATGSFILIDPVSFDPVAAGMDRTSRENCGRRDRAFGSS